MNQIEALHKRNKLMVIVTIIAAAFGVLALTAMKAPSEKILAIFIASLVFSSLNIILYKTKKLTPYLMYIISIELMIFTYIRFTANMDITVFLFLYFNLAIVTLYHDYKPILLSGLLNIIFNNYFVFQLKPSMPEILKSTTISSINIIMFLAIGILTAQSLIGRKMGQEAGEIKNSALEAKDRIESILQDIKYSIKTLVSFSERLQCNITTTGNISIEITKAFAEIAAGVQDETERVTDIDNSMKKSDSYIQSVVNASQNTKLLSDRTLKATEEGSTKISDLGRQIDQVDSIVTDTVHLTTDLNTQTKEINSILVTLNGIAEQTNLLALNANIEAARAGEAGRGFAVVADEIRKLADNSKRFTESIRTILNSISSMIDTTASKVSLGQEAVLKSKNLVVSTNESFKEIVENSGRVVKQVNGVNVMINKLQNNSGEISQAVSSISAVIEESSASVEEVLASVNEQDAKIKDIVSSFQELEELVEKLQKVAN